MTSDSWSIGPALPLGSPSCISLEAAGTVQRTRRIRGPGRARLARILCCSLTGRRPTSAPRACEEDFQAWSIRARGEVSSSLPGGGFLLLVRSRGLAGRGQLALANHADPVVGQEVA